MSKSHLLSRWPWLSCAALALPACMNVSSAMPPPPVSAVSALKGVQVETAAVATQEVPTWLLLTGQLKGRLETDLAANARGRVVRTNVERGQFVKAGEVLATLDVRSAELSARNAEADANSAREQADNAKRECERARGLVAAGALSSQQAERLDAQCRTTALQAAAAVGRARIAAQNVGDAVIRAPFSGFVTERYVDVGEFVAAEARVVTLVDLSAMRLELTIPEASIASAAPGTRVRFKVAAYPDRTFGATLKFVSSAVRPGSRDVLAEAFVDADAVAQGVLRSGMFAAVQLQTGTLRAPVVARHALIDRDGRSSAFVVRSGRLEQKIVQRGDALDGDKVVLLGGLAEGDVLVLKPGADLKNGQPVL